MLSIVNMGQKPKKKLLGDISPNRKAKDGKNSEADCIICDEPILEFVRVIKLCSMKAVSRVGCIESVLEYLVPLLRFLVSQILNTYVHTVC